MNKLGGYIERVKEVAIYNKNIPIKGLSIEKCFVESRIVNLSNIKNKLQIVKRDQFCYKPSTARNGDKLSIALNSQLDAIQISNTYVVFHIKQPDKLINHYLELWIKRIAFDKLARYLSTGGKRRIDLWKILFYTDCSSCIRRTKKDSLQISNNREVNTKQKKN